MSDDWQVGDLALCVKLGKWSQHETGNNAIYGCVYRVLAVQPAVGLPGVALVLDGLERDADGSRQDFLSTRFRKIKPDTEPCEEEFVTLIKRMKPAKVPS